MTSGTHLGLDMRRAFEPGLGGTGRRGYRNRFDRDQSSMNRGLGHWASDLVLLVSEDTGNSNNDASSIMKDRDLPLGFAESSNSMMSRPLFAHQVVLRHRSPVFAEKIREEEARQAGADDGGVGVHICFYIASFKVAYERLKKLGLIWTNPRFRRLDTCDTYEEAVASRQFRFKTVVDLETRAPLLELEHEVRASRHCQFFKKVDYPEGSGLFT